MCPDTLYVLAIDTITCYRRDTDSVCLESESGLKSRARAEGRNWLFLTNRPGCRATKSLQALKLVADTSGSRR
jgi:hypothetical protein